MSSCTVKASAALFTESGKPRVVRYEAPPSRHQNYFNSRDINVSIYSKESVQFVGFEIRTAVTIKCAFFWVPCSLRGTYRCHLQGRRIKATSSCPMFMLVSCLAYSSTLKIDVVSPKFLPFFKRSY
jgi:hypothetical protein